MENLKYIAIIRSDLGTLLMNTGVPDKFISEYLRHSDTNITKLYQHILDNKKTICIKKAKKIPRHIKRGINLYLITIFFFFLINLFTN